MQFTGKQRDTEAGLDNFGARYNASGLGRFMTPDWSAKVEPVPYAKLGDPQSLDLYLYAEDNPTTGMDPDGHWCLFGSLGTTCKKIKPPPTPPPPKPPQGAVGTATYRLVTAQNRARNNPAFRPTGPPGDQTTHCNQSTCSIASQTHVPSGPLENSHGVPNLANDQIHNLLQSGKYHVVSPAEAQALANEGVTVFAGQLHIHHGHIATVRPTNTYFAPYENQDPSGSGPMINNIGGHVDIVPQSGAFYKNSPVIYIAPNNPRK